MAADYAKLYRDLVEGPACARTVPEDGQGRTLAFRSAIEPTLYTTGESNKNRTTSTESPSPKWYASTP